MTDTFLDDQQVADLTRNLCTIATHSSELARIARRESSPPGGRAARNPNGYSSRPPMNLHALDVLNDALAAVAGWCRCLQDDAHIPKPEHIDLASLARHLEDHAHRIAQQQWADDCAQEVDDHARWIGATTGIDTPNPGTPSLNDPDTRARSAAYIGPANEVADLIAMLGDPRPHPRTIRSWGNRGHIDVEHEKGRPVYKLYQVRLMAQGIDPNHADLRA